jgi:hypothetical protein
MVFCSCPFSGGLDNSSPITAKRNWAQHCHKGITGSFIGSFPFGSLPLSCFVQVIRVEPMVKIHVTDLFGFDSRPSFA